MRDKYYYFVIVLLKVDRIAILLLPVGDKDKYVIGISISKSIPQQR